jgi:hypothetical protein
MSVNFSGTWNADLSKCRFLQQPPIAITIKIEHSDPELQEEIVVTKEDGSKERVLFQCRTTGEQGRSLIDGRTVRGTATWQGDELVIESWIQFGARELHFSDYWFLSPEGRSLFMEHRNDDLAGQLTVLERAG